MTRKNDSKYSKALGNSLRSARVENSLSQDAVADALSTTQTAVSRYEAGERTPSLSSLYTYASLTGRSVGDFFPSQDQINSAADLLRGEE